MRLSLLPAAALVVSGFALGWGARSIGGNAEGRQNAAGPAIEQGALPERDRPGTAAEVGPQVPVSGQTTASARAMLEWLRNADPEKDDTVATLNDWLRAVPCEQAVELTEYFLGQPGIFGEGWWERQWPLRTILDHVVRESPAAALAILQSLPEEASLREDCMEFLDTWARRDPGGARLRLLEALHESAGGWPRARIAAALLTILPRVLDEQERRALVDELARLPAGERPDFGEDLVGFAHERVRSGASVREVDGWLSALVEDRGARAEALAKLATTLLGERPAAAQEALRLALAADPAVDFNWFFETFSREAPAGADAFARDLLDPARRAEAMKSIAVAHLDKDGAAGALRWASALADPAARRLAAEHISRSPAASFPEAWSAGLLMGADEAARAQQFQVAFRWIHEDRDAAARAVPAEYLAVYDAASARILEGLASIRDGPAGASLRVALRFEPNPSPP